MSEKTKPETEAKPDEAKPEIEENSPEDYPSRPNMAIIPNLGEGLSKLTSTMFDIVEILKETIEIASMPADRRQLLLQKIVTLK